MSFLREARLASSLKEFSKQKLIFLKQEHVCDRASQKSLFLGKLQQSEKREDFIAIQLKSIPDNTAHLKRLLLPCPTDLIQLACYVRFYQYFRSICHKLKGTNALFNDSLIFHRNAGFQGFFLIWCQAIGATTFWYWDVLAPNFCR